MNDRTKRTPAFTEVDATVDDQMTVNVHVGAAQDAGPRALHLEEEEAQDLTRPEPGRYRGKTLYASGGQAQIFSTFDKHIGREVALKELLPAAESGMKSTPASGRGSVPPTLRFLREARVTGQLEHPNIVPVYELGQDSAGSLYYTMRMVHGRTLSKKIRESKDLAGRMALLPAFLDVCHAIAYAHSRRVVHRDIKPENVVVGEFGETVVLDWGVAKVAGQRDIRPPRAGGKSRRAGESFDESLTTQGTAIGTPAYMSPEQASGRIDEIDERSDVWGLGAMLYAMLTGKAPFRGKDHKETLRMVVHQDLVPVRQQCAEVPVELAAIAEKAMRKDKKARYQSAQELARDISAFLTGHRVRAYDYSSWELMKRFAAKNVPALIAAALILVVILAALATVWFAYQEEAEARSNEHRQRLHADYHLAQAQANQAEHLIEEKNLLSARIYALASLRNNPAYPASHIYEPGFAARMPDSQWLQVDALSLLDRSQHAWVEKLVGSFSASEAVAQVVFSPDGKQMAAVDYGGWLMVWDPATGQERFRVRAHQDRAYTLAYSPNGKRLVTGSRDESIKIWEIGNPVAQAEFAGNGAGVHRLVFSPDGRSLIAGLIDGQILVWSMPSGRLQKRLQPHHGEVRGLAVSPDGRLLASAAWDHTARIWDLEDGSIRHTLRGHDESLTDVSFSPDGARVVTASLDRSLRLWDVASGEQLAVIEGHRDGVYQAVFSPDGSQIVSGSLDRTVRWWNTETQELMFMQKSHQDAVVSIAFSPDRQHLATGAWDHTVRWWQIAKRSQVRRLAHPKLVGGLAYSPNGRYLATSCWDGSLRIWGTHSGLLLKTFSGHLARNQEVVFSLDSSMLAAAGAGSSVVVWDLHSEKRRWTFRGHQDSVWGVAFSPDGHTLATGARDQTARLWDLRTGKQKAVLSGHHNWLFEVAFSPDGKLLASSSADNTVMIWDLATEKSIRRLEGHDDWATSVAFSPDGKTLASAGKDGQAILWNVENGKILRRYLGHKQWINHLTFSADGKYLATAGDDNAAVVWDVASGQPRWRVRPGSYVPSVAFAPDGKSLAVVGYTAVTIHPLDFSKPMIDPDRLLPEAQSAAGLRLRGFELTVAP